MSKWNVMVFRNAKTHVFPATLLPRIRRSFDKRGFKLDDAPHQREAYGPAHKETDTFAFDPGGMCFTDAVWEEFNIPGLTVKVRATDFEICLERLERLPERRELGRAYYKLHGYTHCLCMLPQHRERLIGEMRRRSSEVKMVAYAEMIEQNSRFDRMEENPSVYVGWRHPVKGEIAKA